MDRLLHRLRHYGRPDARARLSVSLLQVTMGVMTGAWGARAPGIRAAIAADDRTWGAVNAVPVVGDVLALF